MAAIPPMDLRVPDGDHEPHLPDIIGLEHRRSGDTLVVSVRGALDHRRLTALDALLAVDRRSTVIVDVSSCAVADRSVLAALQPARWGREYGAMCITCGCGPACELVVTNLSDRFAVFRNPEDALQAKVFADAGYGPGWTARFR